ncbi:MAG: hypothetical protein Q8M31_18980 [Beijerinckiaceae bacterium]|nr:hypothetical protein [Beijerinckiaceae bacterium]
MWIAFLSALLDPIVVGAALLAVMLARNAWQLRVSVASIAAIMSLSELIGGLHEPLSEVLRSAVGAAAGGLLIAEAARFIVAPIVSGFFALTIFTICSLKGRNRQ